MASQPSQTARPVVIPPENPPDDGEDWWRHPVHPMAPGEELWVFGYGSLMWNPQFDYLDRFEAVLHGFHRRFCIYSYHYRGTEDRPGLVLGLDRGGSCRGIAYRVAAGIAPRVADYLWKREMISGVYRPRMCQATLWPDGATAGAGPKPAGTRRRLWTFVARREHVQYYPGEDVTQTVKMIRQGVGTVGANTEYLFATVQHLDELGIPDRRLHRLAKLVRGGTGC